MNDNIIDIKTRKPLFGPGLRSRLEIAIDGQMPDSEQSAQVVTTMEQVVCTEIVCWARDLASKAAARLGDKLFNKG